MAIYIKNYVNWNRNISKSSHHIKLFEELDNALKRATDNTIEKFNYTRFWLRNPSRHFYHPDALLSDLEVRMVTNIGGNPINTMATDGVHLFINPFFGERISQDEFTFVILHEIMHNQWEHFIRHPGTIEGINPRLHQTLWNIATDLEINPHIANMKDVVPLKDGLFFDKPIAAADGYIFKKEEWDGYTAEAIFMKLVDIIKNNPQEPEDDDGGDGEGNHEIEIGDVIFDKENKTWGIVNGIDENEDFEVEEISLERAKEILKS